MNAVSTGGAATAAAPRVVPQVPEPLARLIATSQVPLSLAVPDGGDQPLIEVNDAFERLTGYDRSDLLGRDCRLLQGARTQAAARHVLREAIEARAEGQAVITNYRRGGEEFDNFVFLIPIVAGGGATFYLASQFEIGAEDRTRAFERHGGFLMGAVAELETQLAGAYGVEHDALQNLDRGTVTRRRLENWAQGG